MVDDNVHFEQRHFLCSIAAGALDVTRSLEWYDTVVQDDLSNSDCSEVNITDFARAVVEIVSEYNSSPPSTFIFDFDRLRTLQVQFRKCMYQIICREAFLWCLRRKKYTATVPLETCHSLLHRISNIGQLDGPNIHSSMQAGGNVALEIAREANRICGTRTLPDESLVEDIKHWLFLKWDVKSDIYQRYEDYLCNLLDDLVDQELEQIAKLTPLQILNHRATPQSNSEAAKELDGVKGIAQRIAHITVLHWRVWAPILYLQPHKTATSDTTATAQCTNTDQTTSRSFSNLAGISENSRRDTALSSPCNRSQKADSLALNSIQAQAPTATQELPELTPAVVDVRSNSNRERRCSSPLA